MTYSENSYPTTTSPEYPNTMKTKDNNFKCNLINKIEIFKEERNKSPKRIQRNTVKQGSLRNKLKKTLMDIKENTTYR